ncbi:hypothetical protein F2P81_008408 [Scophthalmus maximus]|uniref:Uncharacterized protein n=1 Tax=Scophthalmus maximus TaxID=52904 RepID=A0A6A4T284_SCOMX|nr:hypothetical protein F2P81_008408 [Scophthalmus maximus]
MLRVSWLDWRREVLDVFRHRCSEVNRQSYKPLCFDLDQNNHKPKKNPRAAAQRTHCGSGYISLIIIDSTDSTITPISGCGHLRQNIQWNHKQNTTCDLMSKRRGQKIYSVHMGWPPPDTKPQAPSPKAI